MWLHILLFILTAGIAAAWRLGWIKMEGLADKSGKRMFVLVALAGNFLGLYVTVTSGTDQVYSDGYAIPRDETDAYEEKFFVSVDGEEAGAMYVQIPEKENAEETAAEVQEELSPEQERERGLQDAVALYNQEHSNPDYYYLPAEWEGKRLVWKKSGDRSGGLLAFMSLFAAFAVLVKKMRAEQEAMARRAEQLLLDYPGLVMKFTLLVQAGMNVRKAFQKIALDYKRRGSSKKRFAYEEILVVCYEMDSGVAESDAYRRFGERCGQIKYKVFATLLIQNLQKGSKRLADMLEKESLEAWDERKRKARVLGEAAATKLLVPMVMMLAVVMAIIMIPAFLSFYGG